MCQEREVAQSRKSVRLLPDRDLRLQMRNAQQQGQEFRPAGAMEPGQQQAVLWSVCTSRAYH
jgi:hypothetical protein